LKKKNKASIVGKGESSILKGVKPDPKLPKDYWDLSVTHLALETTGDQVREALEAQLIKVKDVSVFGSKIKGCMSAKVRIALEDVAKAKSEENWPQFVRVHDWVYKPKEKKRPKPTGPTASSTGVA
jgi:hypothetical protein